MNQIVELTEEQRDKLEVFRQIQEAIEQKTNENRFLFYKPYPKQELFHASSLRERLLIAANQVGKTYSAGNEFAFHVTGQYPKWWVGHRFNKPIIAWAAGVSLEGVRDGLQKILLGQVGQWGTGTIPASRILDIKKKINEGVDFIRVGWGTPNSEGVYTKESFISLKSYDQGREKFQAASVDLIWFDEEPPQDVYSEGITRTNATRGKIMMTFTPLKGASEVVKRFMFEANKDRMFVNMTIEDAPHIAVEDRQTIIDSYLPHEREARTKGIPVLGSGLIFPIEDELITVNDFTNIPPWWRHNCAMDFGWEHPFAAAHIMHDPDKDIIYLVKVFRIKHRTPPDHVVAITSDGWPKGITWQWPHDGLGTEKGKGEQLISQYKKAGLKVHGTHATNKEGGISVEAGLFDMFTRMQTGRFKVFRSAFDFFEEKRLYHRKDGKIVAINDDIISAVRYAVITLRRAKTVDAIARGVRGRNSREGVKIADGAGVVMSHV